MDYNEMFGAIKPKSNYSTPTFTIIYGDVGCGKTTLATSCSELGQTVLINFENRISHIDETETLRIVPTSTGEFREDKACTYDQFMNFIAFVKENKIKIDYLIIDTLDEMFQKFLIGMLKNGAITDRFYGRPIVYDKLWEITKEIKDLGINIIMTAHQKNESLKTDLLIKDALKSKINMNVDNVFYLKKTDQINRVLLLKAPDDMLITKLTTKKEVYNDVPSEIINPTWQDVINEVKKNA